MTGAVELEPRIREVERAQAVHEAVCAERYKAIVEGQSWTNRLVMLANGLLVMLLGAMAAGNPLAAAIQRWLG